MKPNETRSAYILIDMENSFVEPEAAHCIRQAKATIPACAHSIETAREKGIPIFFVKRIYRADGSDVELTRFAAWDAGNRGMTPASTGVNSAEGASPLSPKPGDYSIIKPRWSAFFQTELDLILRRLGVRTVILAGTTTPNCIRTTCYDANSLDYNVVVLTDCCSSQTEEIQRVNLEDMARMGAILMTSQEFDSYNAHTVPDAQQMIQARLASQQSIPEPFADGPEGYGWKDRW